MSNFLRAAVLPAAILLSGCWDFVEPDLTEESGNALFQLNINETEGGELLLSGTLSPGVNDDGLRRRVVNDTALVSGVRLAPTRIRDNGMRDYSEADTLPGRTRRVGPLTITAPRLDDAEKLPDVHWPGFEKEGPDTIRMVRGEPLVIRIRVDDFPVQPAPNTIEWTLELIGDGQHFRVGGNGLPPERIEVAPQWIPAPARGRIMARLNSSRSVHLRASGYRGLYNYIARMNWTVLIE